MAAPFDFDAASALTQGRRCTQEDAVIADYARGSEVGLAVLADGMGGHAAGDVASKIVVTEVFSELMFQRGDVAAFERSVTQNLQDAALAANACLNQHITVYPETRGMGATLVATVIINRNLYWISIGDSPLFLFRDGVLSQLNEDHSMAPQIEYMVRSGVLSREDARRHPERNSLTSALSGTDVARIDCPTDPFALWPDDVLIVASDGLQFLSNAQIADVMRAHPNATSAELTDRFLQRIDVLQDPDQDNVSFSVVRLKAPQTHRLAAVATGAKQGIRCVG
ncbi:protein phosphatase 2C domain-containing protein [Roseobacter sp.]|uniref:PP2C family protein-serine/threonine phosphatase n=1 Tax=Roseobacter sp. TaxID=1907202 RepID=UPI00329A7ACE